MKILRKLLLLCTLIALLSGNVADKSPFYDGTLTQNGDFAQNDDSIDYRLPTNIKPISYDIKLIPYLKDNFTFTGYAKIGAIVERETNNVTLHVGNIEIKEVSVISYNLADSDLSTSYDDITEKFTITVPKTLKKGKHLEINFAYKGVLSDNMIGFYRSSYFDENQNIKWLAATQFQTTHARHAFPCFDEPSLKAKFTIRIARDDNYRTLSNMQLAKSEKLRPDAKTWDVYKESVPMSTYLVAFIISDFEYKGTNEFKVWSKPSTLDQTDYALRIGPQALKLFEKKFNEKYALNKTDMVAVPDFSAGAMENWGLVTYRESRMLYDEKESSATAQQSVASAIAHELTHMWFGNLVTPEWWGCLWLSEGFARFFQYFGIAKLEPNWKMEEQFVVEQHQSALIVDGLESSLPMTREISSKSQIAGAGDKIIYNKGASIVRMMNLIFGTELFENALRKYILDNKVKGLGHPDALWTAIQDQITDKISPGLKIDVKIVMNTWTTKPGYPVISIGINDNGVLNITQERFLLRNLDKTPKDKIWSVPLTFTTQSKPDFDNMTPKYWISTKESVADLKINPKEWFIFNIQSSGFYRVNYDNRGWKNILNTLETSKDLDEIHVLNRAGIVDDLLNLGRAGYQNYDLILDGLLYLKKETNYLPFKAAFNGFEYLNKRFTGHEDMHTLFKVYVLTLIENIHDQLKYQNPKNDDRLKSLLRQEVNNWLCNFDDNECITTYRNKFEEWKINAKARIEPNERPTTYCVAIRYGTSDDWKFLWNEYFNSNHAADQIVILNALGCSQNTTILENYLKSAITGFEKTRIRKQDSTTVFAAVYNSGLLGAECVLDFVEKYYKEIEEYYGGQDTIATILDGASQRFSTIELVDKFERFVNKYKGNFASIQKSLLSSLRIAKYELEWYKTYSASINRWLQRYDESAYRLPKNIIPKEYVISVTPYFETGESIVDGRVTIEAEVMLSTSRIVLHSSKITYNKINVMANNKKVDIVRSKLFDRYDQYVFYLDQKIPPKTKLTIDIEYRSNLDATELRGFYKSSYENEKGNKRWLVATHLEPIGARKMFPCFDEPAMKATFTVQVNVPPEYEAISNMNWQSVEKNGDRLSYTFFKSVPMSTYLVALIVSDFKSKSIQKNGIELAAYARPNAINQTDYALSVMYPLLNFFENTYQQKYQLPKLFMAALPDFSSGAMENWGLLTYREASMLYDENHSPITNKQAIRNVIAHEISHQWFGNLVSPLWWKYLWLNEGFARYFEYHAPARVFRDKTLRSQFVVDQVHSAFSADSSKSTHPLSHDVITPSEIRSIFDTITYAKGGSILRMVEKTYGTKVFDNSLSDYLKKRKYNVATPDDLYESLQININEIGLNDNIKVILDTWTTQPGYPVVNVQVTENDIIMEQKRFFLKEHEDNSDNTIWHIPITWVSIKNKLDYFNTKPKIWLTNKITRIRNPSNSLLLFNTQQSGYYRVNYDKNYWTKLIDYLQNQNFRAIHEINRAALIDDLMNLARTDYIDYKTVISAIMYLEREDNYLPWRAFFNNLAYLNNRFAGRDVEEVYKKWLGLLVEVVYYRLEGFEDHKNEDDLTKILKTHTRKWACNLNIAGCRYIAMQYFKEVQHSYRIPPNYRDVVYCTAMRMDKTNNTYKFLWQEYKKSNVTTDKLVILSSLACSENKDVLETLLREAVAKDSSIRYQDSAKVFSNVYDASLIGVEVVMKVIETHYDDILHKHFNDYTKIANIVNALASRLSTYDLYDKYQKLLNWLVNKEPKFKKFVDSYLATAKYEFEWYERKVPVIFETLDNLIPSKTYRLPKTLEPKLYNIYLTPHMEEGTFEGKVEIHMKARESTPLIVLNSHKLKIVNIKVVKNDSEIPLLSYNDNLPQRLKIYLSAYVHTNEEIIVEIQYNGILNDDMNGFYRSSYLDEKGVQHWLATTHFEPTYARQAFPCFDEPEFKSKFKINVQRPNHYNSRSNMPREEEVKDEKENYTWDIFNTTNVDMSTYLVAFVVSEFKPADNSENVTLNVWGRPEVAAYGKYAQDIGEEIIDELQNITGIEYALPKLDLMGIPDFSMGAMENWGLATFREYGLFYDKEGITPTHEINMITVIAHELAHMWFGNLVTCDWWDYIWLNEGFAEYFQWFISDQIRPKYNFMDQFVVYELHPALLKDATISTHPMTNPVKTPEEIAGIFDYVTYGKSASVLRMIFNAVDQEKPVHILALRDYLTKRMNRTARPTDLWESFEKFVSIRINHRKTSIEEIMNTWTNQGGYPVVNATLTNSSLTLTQERFFLDKYTSSNEFYWIPISIYVPSDEFTTDIHLRNTIWLGSEPQEAYINPINDWFIVNYKQTGFYRVNYDNSSWEKLISKLQNTRFTEIDVLNRAQIIDDLFNLARANYVEYTLLMKATQYLKQETHHLPWKAFFNGLSYISARFEQQDFQKQFNKYILNLLSDKYNKVGFDDLEGDHLDKLNQEMILQWACKLNKAECIINSTALFAAWRTNSSAQIPRFARPAVYCTAIKEGTIDDWTFLWVQYLKTNFATEKKIIINALGCSTNKTILQNYLGKAIEKYNPATAVIRRQDVQAVFASVYSSGYVGINTTLPFLIRNIEKLYQYFGNWDEVANLFVNMAPHISTRVQYKMLNNFVEYNVFPPNIKTKLRSAVTIAETNLDWYDNNAYKIRDWITSLNPEKQRPGSSTRIESLNIVFTTLIALISYLLSYY